ncbi:helix-turn-helix domain-containing protein [Microvirga sp. W0021]|uniref:Helix-turn-helix domain-containing protein n=1 Tax=Hohaiivirga grylli TaxID=3133970 RepID=A0ABV0BL66_9HYPH
MLLQPKKFKDPVEPAFGDPNCGGCVLDPSGCLCDGCKIRPLSVCNVLNEQEIKTFRNLGHSVGYNAKTSLFSQDEEADAVFNLTEGMVRLYKLLPDGRRQIVGFALPGDFLGLAFEPTYSFSADAVTSAVACRFPRKLFEAYVDQTPALLKRLHEAATYELTLAREQMVLLGRRSAEERIAAFLIGLRDRLYRIGYHSPTLRLPMSRQDIADFLGLTIETVSRTLTKLAKDKVILIVPDGIRFLKMEKLETLAA